MELVGAAKLDKAARDVDLDLNDVPAFLLFDFFDFGTLILLKSVAVNIE